jgi:predicted TPR repeat methyltransferase
MGELFEFPEKVVRRAARKAAFAEGFRLRKEDKDLPTAAALIRGGLEKFPRYASGWKCLGDVLWRQDLHSEAAEAFAEAVKLRPDDEMSSAGRFFCSIDAERFDNATEEANRFLERIRGGAQFQEHYLQALADWLEDPAGMGDGLKKRRQARARMRLVK